MTVTENTLPVKRKRAKKYLTLGELGILYGLLEHQYVSYEFPEAIALIRKVRDIIEEQNRIRERRQTIRRVASEVSD